MEKDIIDGNLGDKGSYDVEFKGGKLVAKVSYSVIDGVKGSAEIEVGADAVLEALKKAIPGEIDDALLNVLKAGLKL
jgi:hypothetical protein